VNKQPKSGPDIKKSIFCFLFVAIDKKEGAVWARKPTVSALAGRNPSN